MKKIPKEVYFLLSSIQQVKWDGDTLYLTSNQKDYLYLDVGARSDVYSYLDRISFSYYHKIVNSFQDSFSLFLLGEGHSKSNLFTLMDLYQKSSVEVFWDPVKKERIYSRLQRDYRRAQQNFSFLQDRIEEMYYPREGYYHLLLKMSDVYQMLSLGEYFLNRWYQNSSDSYEEVLTVRKIDSSNFYSGYLLDFSSSREDYYVFELANYYQLHYREEMIFHDFSCFQKEFSMKEDDLFLWNALIGLQFDVDGENIENVRDFLLYVQKSRDYLLEEYKKDEKREEKVF